MGDPRTDPDYAPAHLEALEAKSMWRCLAVFSECGFRDGRALPGLHRFCTCFRPCNPSTSTEQRAARAQRAEVGLRGVKNCSWTLRKLRWLRMGSEAGLASHLKSSIGVEQRRSEILCPLRQLWRPSRRRARPWTGVSKP